MDSLGLIPIFVSMLKEFDEKKQRKIILREMLIALLIMIFFLYFGENFLKLLNVSLSSLEIAGGIIILSVGVKMVQGTSEAKALKKEPFVVPLATPMLAGPSILTMISLYAAMEANNFFVLSALSVAWLFSLPILLFSSFLKRVIGQNGLIAIEKLFGYVLVLLSMRIILEGVFLAFGMNIV